jgi:hypothetical protein
MVERQPFEKKFNAIAGKIQHMGVFWFKEYVTCDWHCQRCRALKPKGSIAFELSSRNVTKIQTMEKTEWLEKALRHFLCLDCAAALLEETLDKVNIVKAHGKNGFKLIEGL